MSLSADCDNCFQHYDNLPANAAGKTFKCKSCGNPVRVERGGNSDGAFADLPPMPASQQTASPGRARSNQGSADGGATKTVLIVLGAIFGGVVMLLVGFALIAPLFRNRGLDEGTGRAIAAADSSADRSAEVEPVDIKPTDVEPAEPKGLEKVEAIRSGLAVDSNATRPAVAKAKPAKVVSAADAERRRSAFVEMFNSKERTKFIATMIEGMTSEELAELGDASLLTTPLLVSTSLMMVPTGFDLNDDDALKDRQKLVVKNFGRRDNAKPFAGVIARMTVDEYREWEREMCEPQLEAVRRSLTRPPFAIPGLKPEQVTFTANGYELPAGIRERVMDALRRQVERGLTTADKVRQPIEELPFWAPLEVTAPEEPVSWKVSLRGTPKIPNSPDKYVTSIVPGPFAVGGLTGFNSGQLRGFDLRTGKSVGELAVPIENGDLHLSPDGTRVILEKTMPGVGKDYLVYSLESGQLERTISSPTAYVVSWAGYVTPTRFVTFESTERSSSEPNRIHVYDVETGDDLQTCEYSGVVFDDMIAVSPDARYIARLTHGFEIDLFDLKEGRAIAQKKLDRETGLNLESIAFSHSGKELAILGRDIYEATRVITLDTSSGRATHDFWLPGDYSNYVGGHASYEGREIAWFPGDEALWIAGASVVDLERERELLRYAPKPDQSGGFALVSHGVRIPAENGVVMLDGYQQGSIAFMPVDFEALRAVADTPIDDLALALGDEVSVEVAFEGVEIPDGADETLAAALTEALEAHEFSVVDGSPIALRLSPGKAKPSSRSGTNVPTTWLFDVSWVDTESKKTYWTQPVSVIMSTAASTASPVEGVARQLAKKLKEARIPNTVLSDGKGELPAVGQLGSSSRRRRR